MSDQPDAVVGEMNEDEAGGCPVAHDRFPEPSEGGTNTEWWPNRLNLNILAKNPAERKKYLDQAVLLQKQAGDIRKEQQAQQEGAAGAAEGAAATPAQ